MRAGYQCLYHTIHIQFHCIFHLPDYNDQHGNQAEGLERVGPDDGFNTTSIGVKPNKEYTYYDSYPERNIPGTEYVVLQDKDNQIKPCCCSYNFG